MSNLTPHIPMDDAHLRRYAINAAQALTPRGTCPPRRLISALRSDLNTISETHRALTEWAEGQSAIPPSVEWILDNYYLAAREGQETLSALRRGEKLRRCSADDSLLQACAKAAVWGVPDLQQERLSIFLEGFQSVHPLTEQELSLLVPALARAILRQLAGLCTRQEALKSGAEHQYQLECIFSGLRRLKEADWAALLEQVSALETVLREDPSGHYPELDETSRRRYRQEICRLARKYQLSEPAAAKKALALAREGEGAQRHVGWYLFRSPLGKTAQRPSGKAYGLCILALTGVLTLILAGMLGFFWSALLLVLPLSDLVKNCVDFLAVRVVPPRPIHRMELEQGIPPEGKTLCVVVSLLTGADSGARMATLLERYRLANRDSGEQLCFGILADVPDSSTPLGSAQWTWIEAASQAVEGLNKTYGGGFYLFFRQPTFQSRDECYQGWERKRGALLELVALLKGRSGGLKVVAGRREELKGTKYVITLDGDTALAAGAARQLVGAMLHPLNRPELDPVRQVVTAGYGLLQPRISVELTAANRSLFSRIYGGQGGVDPYGSTASDVYHDLFDEGTYTGKGIFDVDAFDACLSDRFPDQCILSHDLLEGCYLHAGLMGEVELTDEFPYKVSSYFARLHRWVRGDWQTLPWLFRRVPAARGEQEENPLSALSKWKIFDNLRRTLSPVFTLLALVLGICFSDRVFAAAGAVAVLAAASNLLLSGVELAARRGAGSHVRYHSTIIAGLAGTILQTLIQLVFLPYQAFVCATAAMTALWRMTVSRRKLLSWVTAAQSDSAKGGLLLYLQREWFSVVLGALLLFRAELRFGALVGLVWMLSPVLAWHLSRPVEKKKTISHSDRAFLLHQASLIWKYFETFLRPEDHYLPPDNWQEQPPVGLARRTSPTNIGMAMLSVMAAVDLDLTSRQKAVSLLANMVAQMERLPKWNGHLYNWYDTATAQPLMPRYVSTVDSGNLCACLIALREGLYEWGEGELAKRCEALSDAMLFRPLYDARHRLFSIGYEVEQERLTQGWYDLMASEARQTSFLAVARGEVPLRHWRKLGRMLLGDNDYRGMASWTGTMFEFFMPNLLMCCEENSFLYETLAFCVYAQRRRGAAVKAPWGVSESGFFASDPGMNYQYKAHGVQTLGLKRGLDREYVLAPYASFLALLLSPRVAVSNLRRLRNLGLEGIYGLYEAADFTSARLTGSSSFEIVRSYMSHHLGMSLVAIDNVLHDNVMQGRFMRDCSMSAYRQLLQERVPVGAPVMRNTSREIPEKPQRYPGPTLLRQGEGGSRLAPQCHLLSSGGYTVLACDNGMTASRAGDWALTLARPGEQYAPAGVSVFFSGVQGTVGFTPAPLYQTEPRYFWQFTGQGAHWSMEHGALSARMDLTLPPRENAEVRTICLRWSGTELLRGEVLIYLEPVLNLDRDYAAHPAFSKLFLSSEQVKNGVLLRRRSRAGERLPVLAVLWDEKDFTFTTSRELALGRGALRALSTRHIGPLQGETGAHPDPCLLLRIPVHLNAGQERQVRIVLSASDRPEAALESAQRVLQKKQEENHRLTTLVQRLGMEDWQVQGAFRLLQVLIAIKGEGGHRSPQAVLWPFGISGDLPLAAGEVQEETLDTARLWCKQHQLLRRSGFSFDLALLTQEGGDYRRPVRTAVHDLLKELGAESALGAKGGIHLICRQEGSDAILNRAEARLPLDETVPLPEPTIPPVSLEREPARWGYDAENNVQIYTGTRLPPLGWSQVLCNESFGWITDESGSGYFWQENAREGRLSPWGNDPLAVGGWERLRVKTGERTVSVFADGDGLSCLVTYGLGFARWEKKLKNGTLTTTAFVPLKENHRVLHFTLTGEGGAVLHRMGNSDDKEYDITEEKPLTLLTKRGDIGLITEYAEANNPHYAVKELELTMAYWREKTAALEVNTPDDALNRYLNGWCLYQTLACRVFARTSQYQNGGAYGFRDQLQDVCALLYSNPALTKQQLLRCAARQFEAGDVQHWWHPPQGAGVRTRISDDLLWLPYVLSRYLDFTGDYDLCREQVPYLSAPDLKQREGERYDTPNISQEIETMYQHACRAVECFLTRGVGSHGLPLMGTGDWNDGMNRVGADGTGESVWLGWFGAVVLEHFAPVCRRMGDSERADRYRKQAQALTQGAQQAWDKEWYLRGYYDDGTPLGQQGAEQCAIDSIAQSFSAFVSQVDTQRANLAVSAAIAHLFDRKASIVRLFSPPFTGEEKDPGYIAAYHPGMRENGGQYTHAAVWLAMACFRLDRAEEGYELLRALLPEKKEVDIYKAEPYVLAADVYAAMGYEGRGGWSWYTGAAGWYYQAGMETLLGIRIKEGRLQLTPCIPKHWPGYTAKWRFSGGCLTIAVRRTGQKAFRLDGKDCPQAIELQSLKGEHRLEAEL